MKKIVYSLTDADVKLVKFHSSDPYEGFDELPGRMVENVVSESTEVQNIKSTNPIALIKQSDGSYWLITKKTDA